MSRKPATEGELGLKVHLRFRRLPNKVLDLYDDLVYRSRRVIIGRSQITSGHSVVFDGRKVLTAGFPITYFELAGKWFNVVKVRDLKGRHTGYYCDIVTPFRLLEDCGLEFTDLFLDLWVSPDLRYKVLDEAELEDAFKRNWISKRLYLKAKKELQKLVSLVEQGKFPPREIRRLEAKLRL